MRRRVGAVRPHVPAAAILVTLLVDVAGARNAWRQPVARARSIRQLEWSITLCERYLPEFAVPVGSPAASVGVVRRARSAGAVLRGWQHRIIDTVSRGDYTAVCTELAEATVAVAAGDWSRLTPAGPVASDVPTSRRAVLVRRVMPSVLLAGLAIGLPYLPGLDNLGPAQAGIQVGLLLAAILNVAPVDQPGRERIIAAIDETTRRN